MVPSWADQVLLQLLMEQLDTLPMKYRHTEHMHEGVWLKNFFLGQNDSFVNLENYFPIYGFCICMDSAFMGRSTPTTAFDAAI